MQGDTVTVMRAPPLDASWYTTCSTRVRRGGRLWGVHCAGEQRAAFFGFQGSPIANPGFRECLLACPLKATLSHANPWHI